MRRYENGILYYDEVMAFTFLFSDARHLGPLHPDKTFFFVDMNVSNLGLFNVYAKAEIVARFIKKQGMIPLIRITWSNRSMYSDALGEDIWSKGMFNAAVKAYIAEREERFLPQRAYAPAQSSDSRFD